MKYRASVLVAVVVCFGLYANLDMIKMELRKLHRPRLYDAALYATHLEPVKALLPEDAIVGYVTEPNVDGGLHVAGLFLTQYVLCPVLVKEGKHQPLVIGNFYGMDRPGMSEVADMTLIEDFGHGIRLYRGQK